MAAFDYFLSISGDCSNTNSGAFNISLSGGTPPYSIEFVDPYMDSTPYVTITGPITISGLSATTYGIRVNDSTLTDNLEFFINIPISSGVCASISATSNTTCGDSNGSVTATTTSYFSTTDCYLYNMDDQLISNNVFKSDLIIFENLSADTYYLYIEDVGGCSGLTESFIINDSIPFDFGYYVVGSSPCFSGNTGKIYITGQTNPGPYTYFWNDGSTGSTKTNLSAGTYSVEVTDGNDCVKTKIIEIVDAPTMGTALIIPTQPTCFLANGALDITITGGTAPFYYSANTGFYDITYDRNIVISGLSSGSYQIVVTDAALCEYTILTSLDSVNGVSSVSIDGFNSICSQTDGAITLSVVGGLPPYTYGLIDSSGNTTTITTTFSNYIFDNLFGDSPSGVTYTAYVQDSSGCYVDKEVVILTENKFTLGYTFTGTTCGSDNATIFAYISTGATAPYDYYLGDNISVLGTSLTGVTFNNVEVGGYQLRVVDVLGCTQFANITIQNSSYLDFSLYPISCYNGNDAIIEALITSGEPPFTFNWSENISGNPQNIVVSGLSSGSYSLTITDSNNCSLRRETTINCATTFKTYQTYIVDSELFNEQPLSKFGLIETLNDGFNDLVYSEFDNDEDVFSTKCELNSAVFGLYAELQPSGYTGTTSYFYTGYTKSDVPSDYSYMESAKDVVLDVPGITGYTYDLISNKINIVADPDDGVVDQVLTVKLKIIYNISCKKIE